LHDPLVAIAIVLAMRGIQIGDTIETKQKQPTRKGKVVASSEYLTWLVEFKDKNGEKYTET
jgi:hypothetical protein